MRSVHLSGKNMPCAFTAAPENHLITGCKTGEQENHNSLTGDNYRMHLNASRSSSCVSNPGCALLREKASCQPSCTYSWTRAHRRTVHTRSAFRTRRHRHLCHILAGWVDSQLHAGVVLHCRIKNSNVGHIERVTLKNEWACEETHQVPKLIV